MGVNWQERTGRVVAEVGAGRRSRDPGTARLGWVEGREQLTCPRLKGHAPGKIKGSGWEMGSNSMALQSPGNQSSEPYPALCCETLVEHA